MEFNQVKFNCTYYKGDIPCLPNKEHGSVCSSCTYYEKIEKRILIIKLGALGDVIRTTPILEALRKKYGNVKITWLTHSPSILNKHSIERILPFNGANIFLLQNETFDVAINLDKDKEACMLINSLNVESKFGYGWNGEHITGYNKFAENKIITGLFDEISKANVKDYVSEIYEICDLKYGGEHYQINKDNTLEVVMKEKLLSIASNPDSNKKIIGLNTGCGKRWKTRLWLQNYWVDLVKELHNLGYRVILLGGEDEHEQNLKIAKESGAGYEGFYSLKEFIALCSNIDLIVTQVSMAMHIAIAVRAKIVLMNNIFNKYEFNLMGLGTIIEPNSGCDCYFGTYCSRETRCMHDLPVTKVVEAIKPLV